ncbi:unnamed protein product, partial [Iphiclides podalirius]
MPVFEVETGYLFEGPEEICVFRKALSNNDVMTLNWKLWDRVEKSRAGEELVACVASAFAARTAGVAQLNRAQRESKPYKGENN